VVDVKGIARKKHPSEFSVKIDPASCVRVSESRLVSSMLDSVLVCCRPDVFQISAGFTRDLAGWAGR
jgi:hypothetical protein